MMSQFDMVRRGTDEPEKLTVVVSGRHMTLFTASGDRGQITYFVPMGFQNELLRTMRRRDPYRLGRLLDRLQEVNGS